VIVSCTYFGIYTRWKSAAPGEVGGYGGWRFLLLQYEDAAIPSGFAGSVHRAYRSLHHRQ